MDDTDLESIPLKKRHNNIPWIEKYRPTQFTDIVLEPHNRRLFENIIEQKSGNFC